MKISYSWLKDYIDVSLDANKLSELLTDCGLEVEGVEQSGAVVGGLEGLIVGEIKSVAKHSNADKLSIASVDVGDGKELTIVCGAPNVNEGQKSCRGPGWGYHISDKGREL